MANLTTTRSELKIIKVSSLLCCHQLLFIFIFSLAERETQQERPDQVRKQSMHCETFLRLFCEDQCDELPGDHEFSVKYCAPYGTKEHVYHEFQTWWLDNGEDTKVPSQSTFTRVWSDKFSNLGLMRCKGNFSTCSICNAGNFVTLLGFLALLYQCK